MSKAWQPAPQLELVDRPRQGGGARRHLRGHQQHALDQSRLGLHQRLPEPRPHAARHRAGRRACAHAGRRNPDLQRRATARASWCRCRRSPTAHWSVGPTQIVGFNGYPSVRISGIGQARLHHRRRDGRDGTARRRSCRAASATNGPASRCRKSSPARRRRSCWPCRCCWCSCARRALRKLDHPAGGAAGRAARRPRRGAGRDAARLAERRLLQGRHSSPSSAWRPRTRS